MSAPPPNPAPSDTSFRRTWDRATYAAKAAERETTQKLESIARHDAKLAGRVYHPPPSSSSPSTTTTTTARAARLDVSAHVGKTLLVPLGAATGKRGRGAGFYCGDCDLTYKDNVQFVEHLNSRQHLLATGQSGEVRRASVQEVRERLGWLVLQQQRRREEDQNQGQGEGGLARRLGEREREMLREGEERRRVRNEKRRRVRGGGVKEEEEEDEEVRGGIIC